MEILCRLDAQSQTPVVFLPEIMVDDNIQCWKDGKKSMVNINYYHSTGPLSASDERVVKDRFAKLSNIDPTVLKIRQRLPRTTKRLPDRIAGAAASEAMATTIAKGIAANNSTATPPTDNAPAPAAPATSLAPAAPIVQATPGEILDAINAIQAEFNAKLMALAAKLTTAS